MKRYLIGLTGNIACGKSTVLAQLAQRGAQVLDADQVTHALQEPGQPVYAQIVAAFGSAILAAPAGPIDRRKLGAIVFNDPAALQRLEAIVHPAVRARIAAWLDELPARAPQAAADAQHSPPHVAVIDAIKLLESGWKERCDAIWVVTCRPEQQIARLMETRGMSKQEAQVRVAAQPPQADKITQADVIIDNSGTREETVRQINAAWAALVEHANRQPTADG